MFSIAAINDTDSRGQWEPLAPTKEAQEFHLSQTYHDGLLKLQAKDYGKAQELLETVLKDPLVSNAQVDKNASDGHLLQLRFLALKNLATVFLQQGSSYYESALHCYLQAVEIDSKDSVVWNQLGTLACSMGLLTISRWAFEQGLFCSPNNWNCMEKLLEVLIAIGDEVACLSVAGLILRHWPSHSRALHVKNTIEEAEPVPFAPRGIDKLEPKHIRLKFADKRKATHDLDEGVASKRSKQEKEIYLSEVSWTALARELLNILTPLTSPVSEDNTAGGRTRDIRVSIQLPSTSLNRGDSKDLNPPSSDSISISNSDAGKINVFKEKEGIVFEEQPQERRSSRLERLRSRKPGKEESDCAAARKDLAKVVLQFLEPFLMGGAGTKGSKNDSSFSFQHAEITPNSPDKESENVLGFIQKTLRNHGAYHMGHLLLEEVACRGIYHQESLERLLDLEKLTRDWGQERTPECSLFLAELYYDFGLCSADKSALSNFVSDASYHLCKIIESVATDYPFHIVGMAGNGSGSFTNLQLDDSSPLNSNYAFWIRFFWLSGRVSVLDGNKAKAREEFSISFSLFTSLQKMDNPSDSICLAHCKGVRNLTVDRVLHEINLLEVDLLLNKIKTDAIEKDTYKECIDMLVPLLCPAKDVHPEISYFDNKDNKGFTSVELSALDVIIRGCEKAEHMNVELYLNCHQRRLQILLTAAGAVENPGKVPGLKVSNSETESTESQCKDWYQLFAEEVKAISECVSRVKSMINHAGTSNGVTVPITTIGKIQSLLLTLMCSTASTHLSKKSSSLEVADQNEQNGRCFFVDAAIAFCKLQHLNPDVSIKTQTELIVAIHDMLAEFGLCCARGEGDKEEGTFLKLAIKHLLALDMKLKSSLHSVKKGEETTHSYQSSDDRHSKRFEQLSHSVDGEECLNSNSDMLNVGVCENKDEAGILAKAVEGISSQVTSSSKVPSTEIVGIDDVKNMIDVSDGMLPEREREYNKLFESENELTEEEREELELGIDSALDQCFYCLYGLNLRSDSSYEDELAVHKNTSRGDYQTKEQCADVFQYILPYAKASSKTGLVKLRRVLKAIRKHFPHPPDDILTGNAIDKFLDDPNLCEDKLSEDAGSDGFLDSIKKMMFSEPTSLKRQKASVGWSCEPYLEVYSNLYYLLAQSEEISASDKWAGFVLTKEGEDFVEQNANLFKYDLLYNPLRLESWQRLANFYDEEVDLLLNDGSKQINVLGWRKNTTLPQRVETSRRRSRRCLLVTLALAKTAIQRGEIHELLALVYYDGLQNVVPFYDQRLVVPSRDAAWVAFCLNSMRHFKNALAQREDWSYAFYLGKLSEKLGYSDDVAFSYYDKAVSLNPSAVDPFYRMHASRLKLLYRCGKQNFKALKVINEYAFSPAVKEAVANIFDGLGTELLESSVHFKDGNSASDIENQNQVDNHQLEEVWHMLYDDCLSALEICVEGDLKHFHKARYMLAQGLYRRAKSGDLERAKEELSFCFRSSRSSFTINMWEIDSMVKKGRRKAPGLVGNRKAMEVNLPESSRKFITCIRKYMLFYLKLLEETGDISTLDRAYVSLRSDKRFSLCLEDLVPVALGRYIKALMASVDQNQIGADGASNSLEHLLEKLFSLFLEQVNLWSDVCSLPEFKSPEFTESSLYGYLCQYIQLLERNVKAETLEGINEKIRKRLKNPKLSNSNCARVYKLVSIAWCRSLVISMALITPLHSRLPSAIQVPNLSGSGLENLQLLCVDLQSDELWNSSFEDPSYLKNLEAKWNPSLSKIKNVIVKRASDEDLENAAVLLKSAYNFYKDTSCALLPSGINLYMVPSQLAAETYIQPGIDGVDILDMNTSRKLLLWAYSLLYGYCTSVSAVIKYCEESAKSKIKRGIGNSSVPSNTNISTGPASHIGGSKEVMDKTSEPEARLDTGPAAPLSETDGSCKVTSAVPCRSTNTLNEPSDSLPRKDGVGCDITISVAETGKANIPPASVSEAVDAVSRDAMPSNADGKSSVLPRLLHCNNVVSGRTLADNTEPSSG